MGCITSAERDLLDAKKALESCDLRTAHEHFDSAYAADETRAALGFAMTDLLFLVEDPAVVDFAKKLGFTDGLDVEQFLTEKEGLLDRFNRGDSCDSIDEFVASSIPHPIIGTGAELLDFVSPELLTEDLLADLMRLDGRLERIARAFEEGAENLKKPTPIDVSGCSGDLRPMVLQAPELYAAAALIEILRSILHIADGYDWDIPVHTPFSEDSARIVSTYNDHLFHVNDPAALADAESIFLRALVLGDKALAAVEETTETPADAAFDWAKIDPIFVADLREVGAASQNSITNGWTAVPDWSSYLEVNLQSVFQDPIDAGALESPLWIDDDGWVYMQEQPAKVLIRDRFSRDLWDSNYGEYWTIGDDWEVDLEPVLNPSDRYNNLFECSD
jgi:hypothetical protein